MSTTTTPRNPKVTDFVRDAILEDPEVLMATLYEKAQAVDPEIANMPLRSFNARYPLQVKRALQKERQAAEAGEPVVEATPAEETPVEETPSEDTPTAEAPSDPPKRKRGRPKGSKNKPKASTKPTRRTKRAAPQSNAGDPRVNGILLAFADEIMGSKQLTASELINRVNHWSTQISA